MTDENNKKNETVPESLLNDIMKELDDGERAVEELYRKEGLKK